MTHRRPRPSAGWARVTVAGLTLVALGGCTESPRPATDAPPPDPETLVIEIVGPRLFAAPESVAEHFASGVTLAALPLRLLAETPDRIELLDLWRVREVDGRVIVTPLVQLDGQTVTLDIWLERRGDRWQIAGWDPLPTPVDAAEPAPAAGVALPATLAPSAFRGNPEPRQVAVPMVDADGDLRPDALERGEGRAGSTSIVDVRLKPPAYDGACPRPALQRAFNALVPALTRCADAAVTSDRTPRGRVTFTITFDAGQEPEPYVSETTLLNMAMSDCMIEALRRIPPSVGPEEVCEVRLPITLQPR